MEVWIIITVAAAFVQNVRSMLQKRLTGRLSVNGATYVRFLYALPIAWLYLAALASRQNLPLPNAEFLLYCLAGGVGQILATACLVGSFAHRNFAVGTALSKTEVVQAAVFGLLVLGDPVGWRVMTGIAVSLVGVLLLSNRVRLKDVLQADRAVLLGLVSGAAFAVAIVSFRGASLALPSGDYLIRAALTLAVAVSMQSLIMGAYLGLFEAGELRRVVRAWRPASVVGLTGMLASAGWFTAVTLESAALVRAVGQVELLFTFAASIWFFGERVGWRESAGVVLVVIGIWVLL
ncbi:MAG: EamA family transporter [Pseudomonadales bacterium]|nr:DMT family transporter [Pseudomonadales bacterium]NIX08062.1 EamA family transporter [Pseudomonadales bacterium]